MIRVGRPGENPAWRTAPSPYLLHLKNEQDFAANSLKVVFAGIKFYDTPTCPRD